MPKQRDESPAQQSAFVTGLFHANTAVHALLESLPQSVVGVDGHGRVLLFNQRAQSLFGYSAEEMEGKFLTTLIPSLYADVHGSHMEHSFSHPQLHSEAMEMAARRKNGEEFPIEVNLSFLETEIGILALALITDISQRKQWAWDLQARNQKLDAFAHMVAHDLSSSLSLIIGYGDFLRAELSTVSEVEIEGMLDTIVGTGHKMNSIIRELLFFAQLRNQYVKSELVASREIIGNALQRLSAEIAQSNAQVEIPDEFANALGYAPWLEEVWFNLLSNAIKYGGEPPRIRIGSEKQGDFALFWVFDNGAGMTPEQQDGLFEPFERRHSGPVKGYGLGLSIVKRIVTRLGGEVGISSTPGQGSTFYFTLPAAENVET